MLECQLALEAKVTTPPQGAKSVVCEGTSPIPVCPRLLMVSSHVWVPDADHPPGPPYPKPSMSEAPTKIITVSSSIVMSWMEVGCPVAGLSKFIDHVFGELGTISLSESLMCVSRVRAALSITSFRSGLFPKNPVS